MTTTVTIPTLETERLRLRAPVASDFEAYAAFRSSERARMVGGPNPRWQAFQQLCALAGQWQIRGFGRWIIADKATDAPLGTVGVYAPDGWPEPEIAWSVFAEAEGRGIAYEAALESRRYAYDTLGFNTIVSCISPENTRSLALAKRMGCTQEGAFDLEDLGTLHVWRHPSPAEAARG
ncbi:MAG: GNAT family N-acetyltransferase [Pseudomonadota bacterium]